MGAIRPTGLDSDWKCTALVRTAEQYIDKFRHLIPLRRVSADSPVFSDEDELTPVASVSVMHLPSHKGDGLGYADEGSGRLRVGFADNLSLGDQPIVKVVTVFTTTLLKY
jgi:hypothetical protein